MNTETQLKEMVKEKYRQVAEQSKTQNESSCCGATTGCSNDVYSIMADDYSTLAGYNPEADLGLGCGLPTAFAKINTGDTVIDLGSGAGNDSFVARSFTGNTGKVIGIDFTEKMIELARVNTEKLAYNNVEFRLGDINNIPVTSHTADVVVSNCVLNLVPDKNKVFNEIFRVLKPGGHFSISDIVLQGQLPAKWKAVAELYAGCVSGAIAQHEYFSIIENAGFRRISLQKEKVVIIPDEILLSYLSEPEMQSYRESDTKIVSVTVYAEKPAISEPGCCAPGSGCC